MVQFARPAGDLDNTGSWTPDVESTLWEELDDGASPDGNSVVSDTSPTTSEPFTVDLNTITDPEISTGHILRIRWAKNSGGGGAKTVRIELREGYVNEGSPGSVRATDDYSINSTTLNTDATTLSAGEADSISDYSDLQIRIMGVASNRALKVDFAELEAPDAAVILAGVLFSKPPSFIAGVVTPGGVQLDGVLFNKGPVFIAGSVTPGGVQVDGVLFIKSPAFIPGVVSASSTLAGVLFSKGPTFIAGTITTGYALTGVLFSKGPVFIAGVVTAGVVTLDGVLFVRPPSFISGLVSSGQLDGVLFLRPPSFLAGIVTGGVSGQVIGWGIPSAIS